MPFPQSVKDRAFKRSGGRCECRRVSHDHRNRSRRRLTRCPTTITSRNVQYHHVHAESLGGPDTLSNCEALCTPCHRGTRSYGRS